MGCASRSPGPVRGRLLGDLQSVLCTASPASGCIRVQPLAHAVCQRHPVGAGGGQWRLAPPRSLPLLAAPAGRGGWGVLFACHALFSGVLAWAWLGEVLWGWALLGSSLLVGGVMLAIVWGKRDDESHRWEQTRGRLAVGVALGLLAALCQSVATLMLKPLMSTGIDAVAASAVRMTLALAAHGLLLAAGWPAARARAPVRWKDAWLTFLSAAVAMALGMTLILQAMRHGQAGLVAVLRN